MSNIVSALLMIVAAGIIGAFLVTWANSSFAQQGGQIVNQTATRINLLKETAVLEDVWFYIGPGPSFTHYANVTLRNTGDLGLKVTKIYVNNTSMTWVGSGTTPGTIPIGSYSTLKVTVPWGSGKPQSIWVQTARGANLKQVWTP